MRAAQRNCTLALLTAAALLLIAAGAGRGDSIDALRRSTAACEQDLVRWELTHFLDKWAHLAAGVFRSGPGPDERAEAVREFFQLRDEIARREQELQRALASETDPREAPSLQIVIDVFEEQRGRLTPVVEETLEAAISQTVDELGIIDRLGPVRWPPVDFAFEPNGLLLVRSPRDRIERLDDVLLEHGVTLLEQVALEDAVESADEGTAALVVRIGGVATYPAQVTPNATLHGTLALASHEWLHHWLFFRPLGRAWFAGGELTSVNETVANIFAEEVGDLALERLTGETVRREPWQPPHLRETREPDPDAFDFRREMRETRRRFEELLAAEGAPPAEAYLEERRLLFAANGYHLRKLNTAWFAFHGTYADGPASISPIEGQLRTIRRDSADLAEFLDRVSAIDQAGELEQLAREAGWTPIDPG